MKRITITTTKLKDINLNFILYIPPQRVVDVINQYSDVITQVTYLGKSGFVDSRYLEDYIETLPKNLLKNSIATPDLYDAAQYSLIEKSRKTELCGPAAVALALDIDLGEITDNWVETKSWWSSYAIFGNRGTTDAALIEILEMLGVEAKTYQSVLKDTPTKVPIESPVRVSNLLKENSIISSVSIDKITGELVPYKSSNSTRHWVLLDVIIPEGSGGDVYLINPFMGDVQKYSWREYMSSSYLPNGVIFERKTAPRVSIEPIQVPDESTVDEMVRDMVYERLSNARKAIDGELKSLE